VYQYNFNTSKWMALVQHRSSEADSPSGARFSGPPPATAA
jgi:hypothetical protein